jgi:hypothetical protein
MQDAWDEAGHACRTGEMTMLQAQLPAIKNAMHSL